MRALGHADVLPAGEGRTLAAVGHFYDGDGPASEARLAEVTQAWRPLRTWGSVLLHAAGRRAGLRPPRARPVRRRRRAR